MVLGDSHDKAKTFKKENHLECFFVFLEDAGGLMNEVSHVENLFMIIVEEFDEFLNESSDFLSRVNCVWLIHLDGYLRCLNKGVFPV
jgi:hypothetical protein